MNQLSISIIIPTYNRAHLIGRSIASVLPQMMPGDELIVVDDGSTDDTERVVRSIDPNIRYVRVPNGGPGPARNAGIRIATRDLIALQDSDDEWMPGKLALQRSLMEAHPDVLFCSSDFQVKDGDVVHHGGLGQWWDPDKSVPWEQKVGPGARASEIASVPEQFNDVMIYIGDIYRTLLKACIVATFSIVVRRKEAEGVFVFPADLRISEDWECFARLAKLGKAAYIDCETVINHSHTGPRVTDADVLDYGRSRVHVTESVWGQDPEFLRQHGSLYREMIDTARILKVRGLLVHGRSREAAKELSQVLSAPLIYRVLATLPGPLAKGLLQLRRAITESRFFTRTAANATARAGAVALGCSSLMDNMPDGVMPLLQNAQKAAMMLLDSTIL